MARDTVAPSLIKNGDNAQSLFWEKTPQKRLDNLVLPTNVQDACKEMIEEQLRADLLRSYGLEPRNKMLLVGPPGRRKNIFG